MNWYYVDQGQQAGPVGDDQFKELVLNGKIQPDTLVWHEGMPAWTPYRDAGAPPPGPGPAGGFGAAVGEKPEAVCAECGKMFPIQDMIHQRGASGGIYICALCKPVFLQKLAEGAPLQSHDLNYAGFWIRFVAKFLDGLILTVVLVVPLVILLIAFASSAARQAKPVSYNWDFWPHAPADTEALAANFASLFFQCGFVIAQVIYSTLFLGKYGATPGKMACGLKVVYPDGSKIGYGRAFGRSCAEILSRLICCIGYVIAGFDNPQKRALHDHICNTRVIYK